MQRYEIDRRSIYVANLPVEGDDVHLQLAELAREFGKVERVQVIRKEPRNGK